MVRAKAQEVLDDINSGLRYRELFGLEGAWAPIEAAFYGVTDDNDTGPNIIQSRVDSLVSALATPTVVPMVDGLTEDAATVAPMVEALGKRLMTCMGVEEAMEEALTHAALYGVGVVKIGYDSEGGYEPAERINALGGTLTQFDRKGRLIETGLATPGLPWCMTVSPWDVVVPWGTKSLADAAWIGHRIVRRVRDVQGDKKYKNTSGLLPTIARRDIEMAWGTIQEHATDAVYKDGERAKDPEWIVLWEVMYRDTARVVTVALGGDEDVRVIRDVANTTQVGTVLPWVDVRLTLRARTFWTTPLAFMIMPHQIELDDIHWQAKQQRRASIMKLLIKKGAMDEKAKAALEDARPALFVEVEDFNADLDNIVKYIGSNNNINVLLHAEEESIQKNARDCVGISQNMAGEYDQKNRPVAAETNAVERGGDLRLGRKQKALQRSWSRVFSTTMGLVAAHWGPGVAVRYVGADGAQAWGTVTREVLAHGRYTFAVTFTPMYAETPQGRLQESLMLQKTLAGMPGVDQVALVQQIINASGGKVKKGQEDANLRIPMPGGAPNGEAREPSGGAEPGRNSL